MLLKTDKRYRHHKAKEGRKTIYDGLLFCSVNYYQVFIPKQLVEEVLRNMHGEFGKHPGITKTIAAYREKYYYPNMAQLIGEWVMSCEQCIRESRINLTIKCSPLQNQNHYISAPEDAIENDSVPEQFPFGGYENIVTAKEVFCPL